MQTVPGKDTRSRWQCH